MVRVRFAPSPTGFLHLGGLRTALFNFLFARQNKGSFILRVEDTDRLRLVPGAVESMHAMLGWAGIEVDEGPFSKKQECGPYVQSERLNIYRQHAEHLRKHDHAYCCFCTPNRLAALRAAALKTGAKTSYDGACRLLSKKQVEENLRQGMPYTLRLAVPRQGQTAFRDIVYGQVQVDNKEIDDQVLMKSDGFPTYHFANVVDDHLMGITHIMRGEEWVTSTPKHMLLYQAFGWQAPDFVHLPLLFNKDRSKLSKRQNDLFVESLRKQGYLPMAVNNFVALLGWTPPAGKEVYVHMDELWTDFSLTELHKAGGIVDPVKLAWLQKRHMRALSLGSPTLMYAVREVQTSLREAYPLVPWPPQDRPEDIDYARKALLVSRDTAERLEEFVKDSRFFWLEPTVDYARADDDVEVAGGAAGGVSGGGSQDHQHVQQQQQQQKAASQVGATPGKSEAESAAQAQSQAQNRPHNAPKWVPEGFVKLSAALAAKADAFTSTAIRDVFNTVAAELGVNVNSLMKEVRYAVTGQQRGPALMDLLAVLGCDRVVRRLDHARRLCVAAHAPLPAPENEGPDADGQPFA
eukprot:m.122360 g.122360  ORF g.122360 m.122360 type:complete len:576 (-) comp16221_c1_seq2:22-1749(-)